MTFLEYKIRLEIAVKTSLLSTFEGLPCVPPPLLLIAVRRRIRQSLAVCWAWHTHCNWAMEASEDVQRIFLFLFLHPAWLFLEGEIKTHQVHLRRSEGSLSTSIQRIQLRRNRCPVVKVFHACHLRRRIHQSFQSAVHKTHWTWATLRSKASNARGKLHFIFYPRFTNDTLYSFSSYSVLSVCLPTATS